METTEDQGFRSKDNKKPKAAESNVNGEENDLNQDEKNFQENEEKTGNKVESSETDEAEDKVQANPEAPRESDDQNFKNKFYYLAAELENFRKRTQKEKESLLKYANEKLLLDLIDVV